MKVKGLIVLSVLLIVGVIVWAGNPSKERFSQAKDFPNGTLVYLQIADLPQVIKLWEESKLKEKYLDSQNFRHLQLRHLGIKLAERWKDLNTALGFSLDLQTVSSLAENKAAIAIYDIGKLDIVFIAPMNEAIFSATMFAQNSQNFAEDTLEDGTRIYVIEAQVDRQRQKQKIIFANIKGRFVLATSEKLFLNTVSTITGKHSKQSLYNEPNFRKLSERITPNLATVWVDQEKLNEDYYFKRYWLMNNLEDLKNIRAGIFDLNYSEKDFTEKREFLLKETQNSVAISKDELKGLTAKVPENVPFYRLQTADEKQLGETIYNTLFDKQIINKESRKRSNNWSYNDSNDYYGSDYYYLDSDFDEEINQKDDDEIVETKPFPTSQISSALTSANPAAILTVASPKMLENPLFVEFRKVAIISLKNPNNFQADDFENIVIEALKKRVTITDAEFVWKTENGLRKLQIPMLGWEMIYQLQNNKLFITNSLELLQECLASKNKSEINTTEVSDLTVIRPTNRQEIFDNVMKKVAVENNDFFTGNIASFLDVISDVKQIEVRRKTEGGFLSEEISVK